MQNESLFGGKSTIHPTINKERRDEFLKNTKEKAIDIPDYDIIEVNKPRLYKKDFPWEKPPVIIMDGISLPVKPPDKIWLTDTTFRDGQQAREPYTSKQIAQLFEFLHILGGDKGKILQSEFFLYSKKDREAVEICKSYKYNHPIIAGWIRASKEDLQLIKDAKIEETGIVTPVSDYHIFYKFQGLGRQKVISKYLSVVEETLRSGIIPRVHLEDGTRSDVFGVIVPYVNKLMKLSKKYGLPVKVRFCDTLGVGVPWDTASLPRSIPKMAWVLSNICDVPSECLEFHGHNDFNLGVANATSAWMYGASLNNCTLLGIGERAGNVPLEGMVFTYAAIRGNLDGMNTRVITDIAKYYEHDAGFHVPPYYPIVGENFNVTWAGIHADGLLKNIEMYLPFDTEKLLNVPPGIAISEYSGHSGIAFWINHYCRLDEKDKVSKNDQNVIKIGDAVKKIYSEGRITRIGNEEMFMLVKKYMPELINKIKL